MPLYHLLLDADAFHDRIRPALAGAWKARSFEPCRALCADLVPAAEAFARRYHLGPEEPLLRQVLTGLPFDRDFWRHLAGEALWYSAAEIPEFETAPETLCRLLAPERRAEEGRERVRFAPIEQILFGGRDLVFGGGFYRPDEAGYNDTSAVERLADYLDSLDPGQWTAADLAGLQDVAAEDLGEELEYVRDWFPALRDMYRGARARRQVVVCELL